MSGKSRRSSPRKVKKSEQAIDRPFDPAVLAQAREVASRYRIVLEPNDELGFMGNSIEMPHVWGDGKTPDACVRETREAIVSAIATMLEMGESPPLGGRDDLRTEQINVRLTPREKLLLEEAARSKGFRGISDYVRSTSLADAR